MSFKKYWIIVIVSSFILIGLSLFGIFGPKKEYLTTTGTIVNIVESMDVTTDSNSYKAIIDYEVEGKEYKNVEYGSYNSSMKIGDKVIVYYDPNNPSSIQAAGYKTVPYVILIIGVITSILSIYFFIKQ